MSEKYSRKTLKIVQLYPDEMNIYGDNGNVLVLSERSKLYGFSPEISYFEVGSDPKIIREADILVGGGGQDSGQLKVAADLQKNAEVFRESIAKGCAGVLICGMYQLFGKRFLTNDGDEIAGISVFDVETIAQPKRLIGNIVIDSDFGKLVGFENHSGLTYLRDGQAAFGEIVSGGGNNGKDGSWNREKEDLKNISKVSEKNLGGSEGSRTENCFGSYLHGPILSKNPKFADALLLIAAKRKFGCEQLEAVNEDSRKRLAHLDEIAERAREIVFSRPR